MASETPCLAYNNFDKAAPSPSRRLIRVGDRREGYARQTEKEFIQFLYITKGSIAEVGTQITISKELNYITNKDETIFLEKLDHLSRMTQNFIKSLEEKAK